MITVILSEAKDPEWASSSAGDARHSLDALYEADKRIPCSGTSAVRLRGVLRFAQDDISELMA